MSQHHHPKALIWTDDPAAHDFLVTDFPELKLSITTTRPDFDRAAHQAEVIYLGKRHDRSFLHHAQQLRWLHVAATGLDQLGDLSSLDNVRVSNMPGLNAAMMADYCMGMLMMLTWNMPQLLAQQQRSEWHSHRSPRLAAKTLLILGLGNVGSALVQRAHAAEMRIIGLRRQAQNMPKVDKVYPPEGLYEALTQADYTVCTLPATDQTRALLDQRAFSAMKATSFLINVGRGATIDESALLQALNTGKLAGAALDVFSQEPLPDDHPLWRAKGLIMTPHVSGFSDDYRERAAQVFANNLTRYLAGQALHHLVKPAKDY